MENTDLFIDFCIGESAAWCGCFKLGLAMVNIQRKAAAMKVMIAVGLCKFLVTATEVIKADHALTIWDVQLSQTFLGRLIRK